LVENETDNVQTLKTIEAAGGKGLPGSSRTDETWECEMLSEQ